MTVSGTSSLSAPPSFRIKISPPLPTGSPRLPSRSPRSPSNFSFEPPPWDCDQLRSYCNQVNRIAGSRENKYVGLLGLLEEALQEEVSLENFEALKDNFLDLIEKMPPEIKERPNIKDVVDSISKILSFQVSGNSHLPPALSFSLPPWDCNELCSYCDQVNQTPGSREDKYAGLLILLEEALQRQVSLKEAEGLGCNFLVLIQKMPSEIRMRSNIKNVVDFICFIQSIKVPLQSLEQFCFHLNESEGIRGLVYTKVLKSIASRLEMTLMFEDFESICQRFSLIKSKLPTHVSKDEVVKAASSLIENQLISFLQGYCAFLNEEGSLAAYEEILKALKRAIQAEITVEELHRLGRHLLCVIQFMDSRFSLQMQKSIHRAGERLLEIYCSLEIEPLETEESSDLPSLDKVMEEIGDYLKN